MPTILDMSCISLSPAISKAPVITSSPLKTEYAGKTALLEQLRKRHRKYLKRLKEQPSEETNKTRNCDTITHNFGSPFKMGKGLLLNKYNASNKARETLHD